MSSIKSLIVASAVAGAAMFGVSASAQAADSACSHCSQASATYVTNVRGRSTRAAQHVTRTIVRDVNKTRYVRRIKRVTNVHYRQKIVHVRRVTRVHHRTVNLLSTRVVNRVVTLPTKTVYSSRTVHVQHGSRSVRCGACGH